MLEEEEAGPANVKTTLQTINNAPDETRTYTINDLSPEAKQIILDGCAKIQRNPDEELQADLFKLIYSLSPADQIAACNRFFMSEAPGTSLNLHFTNIFKSYRSIKESYKPRIGDWLCHKCGLWNFAARSECNFKGCRTQRQEGATVMTYEKQKEEALDVCQRFQTGNCDLGDKCRYSHGPTFDAKRKGFESLPEEIKEMFNVCFKKHNLPHTCIDACVYNSLNDFPLEAQKDMISKFCSDEIDIKVIRNKSGYLIGMFKNFRERGKSLSGIKPGMGRGRSRSPKRFNTSSSAYGRRQSPKRHDKDRDRDRGRDYDRDYYSRARSPEYRSHSSRYDRRSRSPPSRMSPRRSPRRLSPRRLSPRRLSPRRLSPRRLSPRRLSPRRSSSRRSLSPRYGYDDRRLRSPRHDSRFDRALSPLHRGRPLSPRDSRDTRGLSPRRDRRSLSPVWDGPFSSASSSSRNGHASPRRAERPLSPPAVPRRTLSPPPALLTRARPVPPASIDVNWFWTDVARAQKNGPSTVYEFKKKWEQGIMDGSCLAWCASMPNWQEIRTLQPLFSYLCA